MSEYIIGYFLLFLAGIIILGFAGHMFSAYLQYREENRGNEKQLKLAYANEKK